MHIRFSAAALLLPQAASVAATATQSSAPAVDPIGVTMLLLALAGVAAVRLALRERRAEAESGTLPKRRFKIHVRHRHYNQP